MHMVGLIAQDLFQVRLTCLKPNMLMDLWTDGLRDFANKELFQKAPQSKRLRRLSKCLNILT